jgi:tRNA G18 (ribose-2'-O)-methylase SpoU
MYIPITVKKEIKKMSQTKLDIILVLDNVNYVRNVAEIFQLAEAFRIRKIIISGNSACPPFGKDLQKASLKAERRVEWEKTTELESTLSKLKSRNYQLYALSFNEEAQSIYNIDLKLNKIALIMGNETNGLAKSILAKADKQVLVPSNLGPSYLNLNLNLAVILNTLFIKSFSL